MFLNKINAINNINNYITLIVIGLIYSYIIYYLPINADSAIFLYIGKNIANNLLIPYIDVWDHKGFILYLLNALGYFLFFSNIEGVYLLEGICIISCIIYINVSLIKRNVINNNISIQLLLFFISYIYLFDFGNLSETWSMIFQLITYNYLFHVLNFKENNAEYKKIKIGYILTIFFILVLLIRVSNSAGIIISILIIFSLTKHKIKFMTGIILALISVATIILFYGILFSHDILIQMIDQYIYYNFTYSFDDKITITGFLKLIHQFFQLPQISVNLYLIGIIVYKLKKTISYNKISIWILIITIDFIVVHISGRDALHYNIITLSGLLFLGYQCQIELSKNNNFEKFNINEYIIPAFFSCLPLILYISYLTNRQINYSFELSLKNNNIIALREFISKNINPNEKLLVFGNSSTSRYYLTFDRLSSSKYLNYYPLLGTQKQSGSTNSNYQKYISDLKLNKPKIIIHPNNKTCIDSQYLILFYEYCDYLKENYKIVTEIKDFNFNTLDPYTNEKINIYIKNIY